MATARCTNPSCTGAATRTPIDYYPGPGRFCPDCGNELTPVVTGDESSQPAVAVAQHAPGLNGSSTASAESDPPAAPSPPPFVGMIDPATETRMLDALAPQERPAVRNRVLAILAAVVLVLIAAGGYEAWQHGLLHLNDAASPTVAKRPIAVPKAPDAATRVCTTSITAKVADAIANGYASAEHVASQRLAVGPAGDDDACDIRFRAAPNATGGSVIGREGIVVVVNPASPLSRISDAALRGVLSGRIVDWSQLGAPRGPIVAFVPPDDSDETVAMTKALSIGKVAAGVQRLPSSDDVTRRVASPSGRTAIGVVAFGSAVPAKVLALGNAPPPSSISIADRRYPVVLNLLIGSDLRSPTGLAAGILTFARTPAGQALVVQSGVVATEEP